MSRKAKTEIDDDGSGSVQLGARWQFGAFELNEKRLELRRDGELLKIESKPMNLLMAFLRQPGELITKNDLVSILWPNGIANDAMLGNCVAKLRTALGEDGASLIKTVFGFGYRFDAEPRLQLDQTAAVAPPKLDFKIGDAPPMRPNWRLVRRLGLSGDSWLVEHVKSRARRVFKFSNEAHGLSALKREVTIYRLLRESLGDKVCYVDLLDWNFDEAPWFIEAEYCPSGSLQEWFIAQGGVDKVPLQTRLDLIIQIAEALAAVHAVGVLHKDLKPANVFVVIGDDARPGIRLADFGSSGLHDASFLQRLEITRAGFTQVLSGANTGTLLYLAPEVAAGQPSTVRADIYALGLMLFQVVTGNLSRQLATGWEAEIDDEILRDDIAAATEGNQDRRLADAAELARRLRTIEARRTALIAERAAREKAERVARQLERIKARRVGLLAAFAALAIGFVTSAWLYVDAREARDLAQRQASRAEQEQGRAEKVAAFLGEDMFASVDTEAHPVKDLTVKQLLVSASAEVAKRFKDEPEIAAKVYTSLGRSFMRLEHDDEAQQNLERALKLSESRLGLAAAETIALTEDLIRLKFPVGELPDHISHYEDIAKAAEQRLGASAPQVLRLKVALARGRVQLGLWARGERELNEIAAVLSAKGASADAAFVIVVERALALVQTDLAMYGEAEANLRSMLPRIQSLHGDRHRDIAITHMRLGRIMYETGRYSEAETELDIADDIAREWAREDGSIPLTIKLYRAQLRLHQRKPVEAMAFLMDMQKQMVSTYSGDFDQSFSYLQPLARGHQGLGNLKAAEGSMREALRSSQNSLGLLHPTTLDIKTSLAELVLAQGRTREASQILQQTATVSEESLPPSHPYVLSIQSMLDRLSVIAKNDAR